MKGVELGVLLLIATVSAAAASTTLNEQHFNDLWINFKKTHNKVYADEAEDDYRRQVFAANVERITVHNIQADLGQHSFTLGVNKYSDLTFDEYKKYLLGSRMNFDELTNGTAFHRNQFKFDNVNLPDTVDWTKQGYVTPVKDQGQCGSCWAFCSTGALEGQNFKATGQLVSLSEQNLIDCSTSFGNHGCDGGNSYYAYNYVAKNEGIDTEQSYSYEGKDGPCRFKSTTVGAQCTGSGGVDRDENALTVAVASIGPISVSIDAGHVSFQSYRGGVYYEPACSSTILNHCVLAVGYGTFQGQDYWLVKNSWGSSWGIKGYVMMARNRNNNCGIATAAVYPTV